MTKPAQKMRGHKKKNRKKREIQFLDFQFQSKGKSNELGSRKTSKKERSGGKWRGKWEVGGGKWRRNWDWEVEREQR